MTDRTIKLRKVRVNNLQEIDLDIPHGLWLAICGISGSGKSSLAFDTLYAEGQRRYMECLTPGARQFITLLDKPDAESIEGIPPAIAVRPVRGTCDRKTTVGNAAEVVEYLRLLFSRIAEPFCPGCQAVVHRHDPQSVAAWIASLEAGRKIIIAFLSGTDERSVWDTLVAGRKNGFSRAIFDGRSVNLDSLEKDFKDRFFKSDSLRSIHSSSGWMVVDRVVSGTGENSRLTESLETAFQFGDGSGSIFLSSDDPDSGNSSAEIQRIDGSAFARFDFSSKLICPSCACQFPEATPKLFSFNSAFGACHACDGNGFEDDTYQLVCGECRGTRLQQDALAFRIKHSPKVGGTVQVANDSDHRKSSLNSSEPWTDSKNIAEVCRLTIQQMRNWIDQLTLPEPQQLIAQPLLNQVNSRLCYLEQVGLGYLTLDRPLRTLSSGETQRVILTSCLSSTLVNMLYVLDEPSVGLHPHDIDKLTESIRHLNDRSNTVVVVDHEEALIRSAPRILEIGPGAGASGGAIVFHGELSEIETAPDSTTGDFLAGRRGVSSGAGHRRKSRGKLMLTAARGHNLRNIDVEFPLGCLCLVTGVSGAGKSTLVQNTLYGAICKRKNKSKVPALPYDDLFGDSQIDDVILVDQSPIGRTPRSNPVTYVKAFDEIRKTFSETTDARTRNVKAGQFSFNVAGGRCDKCNGDGQLTIDMQFLSNVYIKCDQCNGTRYRTETLSVRYRGRNIAEVLNLTVREAFSFFRGQPKVQGKLKALIDVGLDYIRLGQPATTLSCGEAQRLKLAVYLNASRRKRVLFILEEPTTGLHMADVVKLIDCFEALLSVGHSFIIVEHNLQLMKYADWIIDLGPGAGAAGGQVVARGTPEGIAANADSVTGKYLSQALRRCQPLDRIACPGRCAGNKAVHCEPLNFLITHSKRR